MKGEKFVSVEFYIHNDLKTLYFTGKHYLDMRTVVCPSIDNDVNQSFWVSLDNENIPLQIGDIVRHKDYGEGKVVSIEGGIVKVKFSDMERKIKIEFLEKKV